MKRARSRAERPGPDELAGLYARLGVRTGLLTWARGGAGGDGCDVLAVLTRSHLAVARGGTWQVIAWDDILQGGWQEATGTLQWVLLDGARQEIGLDDAGDLPGVFMERVQASIVIQERVPVTGGRGEIIVSGRRNPAGAGQLRWMVQPVGHTDLEDPQVRCVAIAETENLRREYEP